jgi:hypothetical protein
MGTITRAFANNITTSGVFKPAAFNNASFDNVTSVPEGAVEGGNMVLLSTQTASASSSISFTTGITSTYKEYMFIFNNIHPSTDTVHFTFNLSTDSGSNYNVTKTTTYFLAKHNEADTDTGFAYDTGADLAQSTSYQIMATFIGADNDQSLSGTLHLFNPSYTTYVKHFLSAVNICEESDTSLNSRVGGYANTTSAINAIDFKFASGNIDAGTIQMFGIL